MAIAASLENMKKRMQIAHKKMFIGTVKPPLPFHLGNKDLDDVLKRTHRGVRGVAGWNRDVPIGHIDHDRQCSVQVPYRWVAIPTRYGAACALTCVLVHFHFFGGLLSHKCVHGHVHMVIFVIK